MASLLWGADSNGKYLRFIDEIDNVGDSIEYRENGPIHSFTYTDADLVDSSWYVKWDEVIGSGSLRAPDYNESAREATVGAVRLSTAPPPSSWGGRPI